MSIHICMSSRATSQKFLGRVKFQTCCIEFEYCDKIFEDHTYELAKLNKSFSRSLNVMD